MFRKPFFWIIFVLLGILSIFYIYHNLARGFSLIEIDATMSRSRSLQAADSLHTYLEIDLEDYRQATMFTNDFWFQNYVELEGGGKDVFREIIKGDVYEPFYWHVRHFREGETREFFSMFSPAGDVLGFREIVPETEEGPALERERAQAIADSLAQFRWNIDLSLYELIETAQEEKPNGRLDHTFTYQRHDIQTGEALYRLRMVVSGERLTQLLPETRIPEFFIRSFLEMRSFNNTLATIASGLAALLYGAALIVWFIILIRRKQLIPRPALLWAMIVGIFFLAANLNYFSFYWFGYDTTTSQTNFILQYLLTNFISAFFMAALFLATILIAEAVTRKANPQQIQFWRLADRDVAPTKTVLGNVIGSYLTVPLFMALVLGFYIFSAARLGWWIPSRALTNPNILGAYSPAVSALGMSLWAGFWEEAMFRALPLATMAIIGTKLNKRVLFLTIGMIIQVFIFAGVHANYPQQPFYARLIELIVPSLMFAFLYLRFGLLPAVLVHFAYNAVWGSLAFFTMQAPGLWFDRTLFLILFFLPLLFILYRRWQSRDWQVAGKTSFLNSIYRYLFVNWREVPQKKLNAAYQIPEGLVSVMPDEQELPDTAEDKEAESVTIEEELKPVELKGKKRLSLIVAFFLSLFVIITAVILFTADGRPPGYPQPRLEITEEEAAGIANESLQEWLGEEIPAEFTPYPRTFITLRDNRYFVLSRNDREAYEELLSTYIHEDSWNVEYKRYEGDLRERAEQFSVYMTSKGKVYSIGHSIVEEEPGAELSEEEARLIVMEKLATLPDYEEMGLREVSANPRKQPERMDWFFTFTDTLSQVLEKGEPRIFARLNGDQVSNVSRYVFVPEEDNREIRAARQKTDTIDTLAYLLLVIIAGSGLGTGFIKLIRREIDLSIFIKVFILMFVLTILNLIVSWHYRTGNFSTIEPFNNQLIGVIIGVVLQAIFVSAILALLFAFVRYWQQNRESQPFKKSNLMTILAAALVGIITLRFLTGDSASLANMLKLPNYQPALTSSATLTLLVRTVRNYLLLFGLISYLFHIMEKLLAKGTASKVFAYLIFLLAGISASIMIGFPYLEAPFTWVILLRGIFFVSLLTIAYQIFTKRYGDHWISNSLALLGIIPLTGIVNNPFVGARFAYLFSYLIVVTIFLFLPRRRKT